MVFAVECASVWHKSSAGCWAAASPADLAVSLRYQRAALCSRAAADSGVGSWQQARINGLV